VHETGRDRMPVVTMAEGSCESESVLARHEARKGSRKGRRESRFPNGTPSRRRDQVPRSARLIGVPLLALADAWLHPGEDHHGWEG
jgi:hypothetical protein